MGRIATGTRAEDRIHKRGESVTTSNHLSHAEMYALTKLVEASIADKAVSENYAGAVAKFSKQLGRAVTKTNLETAARTCGASVTQLIKPEAETSPVGRVMRIVRALESRVALLEEALK